MGDVRAIRRLPAAVATAAALGASALAAALVAPGPAWAADPLKIKVDTPVVQGKIDDKVTVRFTVENSTDLPIAGLTVDVLAPGNAIIDPADNPTCTIGSAGRAASCHSNASLAAKKSAKGGIVLTVKSAGQAAGRVSVRTGNSDNFAVRTIGGPTPTASTKTPKPSKGASATDTFAPPDETMAPPVAGNGAIPQSTTEQATTNTSGGGRSMGFWIGIVAIVGALGLVGSLFYFRRKDRDDPDTGMHPVVPAPTGFPAAGYGQPQTYGQPDSYGQPQTYGQPTQVINPAFGQPPAGPTQIVNPGPPPGAADQTITFQRPDRF